MRIGGQRCGDDPSIERDVGQNPEPGRRDVICFENRAQEPESVNTGGHAVGQTPYSTVSEMIFKCGVSSDSAEKDRQSRSKATPKSSCVLASWCGEKWPWPAIINAVIHAFGWTWSVAEDFTSVAFWPNRSNTVPG